MKFGWGGLIDEYKKNKTRIGSLLMISGFVLIVSLLGNYHADKLSVEKEQLLIENSQLKGQVNKKRLKLRLMMHILRIQCDSISFYKSKVVNYEQYNDSKRER